MRALISVSDKTGVVEFALALRELGFEILSTGGTFSTLMEAGVPVVQVSEVTGFPECLDGRVKTLHPAVHGGILAMRGNPDHMAQLMQLGIEPIDVVAINLYPFKQTILREDVTLPLAIENIDIGGPTMLRSAAKNHKDVIVVCDPADYAEVIMELRSAKTAEAVSYETKYRLALKVFEHTASYDALIADYLRSVKGIPLPDNPTFTFEKIQDLRYGENPHQAASYYREVRAWKGALVNAGQLHGKELSFNNINDANGAVACLREFSEPTVVAVKHANPCGVGSAATIYDAYCKAYDADPVSIFGGIIAANMPIDLATAEKIAEIFVEIVIAPGFSDEALSVLTQKPNIRLLKLPQMDRQAPAGALDLKKVDGGLLIQDVDQPMFDEAELVTVTQRQPTLEEWNDMQFGMKVVKHVKSNAIVIAKGGQTLGVGPGQTNRIGAARIAIAGPDDGNASDWVLPLKPAAGAILASDAFFPFPDCVELAAAAGVTAIIQPGGSLKDEESIAKCDAFGIAMVFTGMRHFKH
ncbi:MAG: bifunctional phosphoribosylaminoimidazolecarboxamide formyltransferase/IMP cyclohydrolase [Clostridiales Family XIII bacterium]|jgi:phosphoribosylaminoimidazolecarboxamide formyltransferase/IMP cyclohydrolase|nr:bifunctional phosphoribosylaminoimidazolecarboxamide formyltransferase/IMP cyclohydrolase [Clostridiales Family XIII bacterium]